MVAAVLFIALVVTLVLNMPVGIAIGVSSLCAILADGRISSLYIVQQLVTSADSFPLMAIPLDILAGELMGAGGVSKRPLNVCNVFLGRFTGGLATVTIVLCMFFAAVSGSGNVAIYAIEKAQELGVKVVTCSDSTGWIYDPNGIDVALLKEVKEVKRARLTEYAAAKSTAEYHAKQNGEHGVWQYKVDLALPCATQNELDIEDAKMLVANGVTSVTEGANMPTTLEATKYLQENGVLFVGGKAANAGGVATSALEMSQNSERLSWTFEEVDGKLKGIMETIYANISDAAKRYNATVGGKTDYVAGANIAGFEKVVDAMLAQGVC